MAAQRMTARVEGDMFRVHFASGARNSWSLPRRDDTVGIRKLREAAMQFAKENGATEGQQNAVRKALTNAGYYLRKLPPRSST
jgi:hypothetical protein